MRRVRFILSWPPYVAGEEAVFSDAEAARLTRAGIARDPSSPIEHAAEKISKSTARAKAPTQTSIPRGRWLRLPSLNTEPILSGVGAIQPQQARSPSKQTQVGGWSHQMISKIQRG